MSFSDKMRSFWDKDKKDDDASSGNSKPPKKSARKPDPTPVPPVPRQDAEAPMENEKQNTAAEMKAVEKEIQDAKLNLEKLEMDAKNRREAHQQNSQLLKMDAEREIKFLERKLQEDTATWSKHLAEREKAMADAAQHSQAAQQEKKAAFAGDTKARQESLSRTEAALKEQEARLEQERKKWQELLRTKESELLTLKQELARREAALEEELKSQEVQQKAAKELWETRLKELEKQWADKRKAWEEAMKATEDERLRLQNTFQEKQAAWQLEQERRQQDLTRRQERASEKLSTLQAHFAKEAQTWKQIVSMREDQVKENRVKLLLSETDAKGRSEQAQKIFQEKVVAIAQQVQNLQSQLSEEQSTWKRSLETKEAEIAVIKDQVQTRLRQLESEYAQKMSKLSAQKESLSTELELLKAQQKEQQQRYDERMAELKAEETTLEESSRQRLASIQKAMDQETLRLQTEIQSLEQRKEATDKDLESLRQRAAEEIRAKDEALKTVRAALTEQENALKTRFGPDEEMATRQLEALRTRNRALDREIAKMRESLERIETDHAAAIYALETDSKTQEENLTKRCAEQEDRLKKRLEERRIALDAFLVMKKEEEARLHTQLKAKEKERVELTARLADLPKLVEEEVKKRRETAKKETESLKKQLEKSEKQLAEARDQAKTLIQSKAGQLSTLRQSLEAKQKELASTLKTREQILCSERVTVEKQMSAAQAEMDRTRAHWQSEITKKEQDTRALEEEIRKQETQHRQALEREEKVLADQIAPLEKQRLDLTQALERERLEHDQKVHDFEKQGQEIHLQIQQEIEKAGQEQMALESRFRDERARLKAQIDGLVSEQEAIVSQSRETLNDKGIQIEQLEEQLRQQAVAHESRKRELIHSATLKSRTLQDILHQIEVELKASRETFPQDLRAREEKIVQLTQELAQEQARHQRMVARYERAQATLARRGRDKHEVLATQLAKLKDEWAKKLATRDAEMAALQSDLLAKEAERQGELDRLAKQFAEERFLLEKSKEELDWKLKDHKEVSERQLAGREKEIHFLDSEIQRVKVQREQQLSQKAAAFEAEKQKIQTALNVLQTEADEARTTSEKMLAAKDNELQALISKSKKTLTVLSEEFNQKVNSWRSTNETMRGQIDQLKQHWAKTQDHWEALRKEKATELSGLRQELTQWEARLQSDVQALERTHDQERQVILNQLRKKEKEFEEAKTLFERRMGGKEEEISRAIEEIRKREVTTELQWRTTLEQWQTDKQELDKEKVHIEQDIIQLQSRSERELREMEDTIAKLRVEVTFKESQTQAQQERMKAQHEKDLQPLREQVAQAGMHLEHEKAAWETKLQSKENDLKVTRTRLVWREKRLKEEIARRQKELAGIQQLATEELQKVRSRYEAEMHRLETVLKERRAALASLQTQQGKQRQGQASGDAMVKQSMQSHREHLEDSLRQLESQRTDMRAKYETLLNEKEAELQALETGLIEKDTQLQEARKKAQLLSEKLRKDLESIHQIQPKPASAKGARLAAFYATFEQGIHQYKARNWKEASVLFQECIEQDPNWGAAYQYLALSLHEMGLDSEAAWAADQALENNPDNNQLAAWATQLRATLNLKQPPAA